MSTHSAIKSTKRAPRAIHNANSVDVLRGHPLGERVLARRAELDQELETLDAGSPEFVAIDTALATLEQLLGGDLGQLSDVIASDLNNWLERNKYLALTVGKKHVH